MQSLLQELVGQDGGTVNPARQQNIFWTDLCQEIGSIGAKAALNLMKKGALMPG